MSVTISTPQQSEIIIFVFLFLVSFSFSLYRHYTCSFLNVKRKNIFFLDFFVCANIVPKVFLFGIQFAVHTPPLGGSGRDLNHLLRGVVLSCRFFFSFGTKNAGVVHKQLECNLQMYYPILQHRPISLRLIVKTNVKVYNFLGGN